MTRLAGRIAPLPTLVAGLMAALCTFAVSEADAAKAGPAVTKCGKLKKQAQKRACLEQNQANRLAFNQIKNSKFVGQRGDGEYVEDIYCANGKFESRSTSSSYGTGVSTGRRWKIDDAVVRQGGMWINAILKGPEGFEIGLQRRGTEWLYGITRSFGEIEQAGPVEKTNAAGDCATLQV